MSSYFKAIAVDYDGTLTEDDYPPECVLSSLQEARDAGMALLLVTGRVVSDLLHVFPDAEQRFDVIVAENGAVIRRDGVSHPLTTPVPVPLQNPVNGAIVDVSALGIKLPSPDASLAVRPASDRQIELEFAARTRS
jgi:predicted mannosyl-3-phosphoglycerate phosphatase (HAD superfamily)